ncbi:MAG TPA: hypothetical protein VHY84_03110 [Bryobacteraceae bacterium]|jgi:hypothetical protein|nr:hypothetical protein [Bryobacteraceae bacterium]
MSFEVLSQLNDTIRQQCDLHFRRPGVGFMILIPGYNLPLCFCHQCHLKGYYSLSSLFSFNINASVTQIARGQCQDMLGYQHLSREDFVLQGWKTAISGWNFWKSLLILCTKDRQFVCG